MDNYTALICLSVCERAWYVHARAWIRGLMHLLMHTCMCVWACFVYVLVIRSSWYDLIET